MIGRPLRSVRSAAIAFCAVLSASLGCASFRAANAPLSHWDPDYGYRAPRVQEQRPMGDLVLVLAFSGGGTRAAALSYGVLQALRETPVEVGGEARRLLDEVDMITSVSGGSFTSSYYGLFGDRIFEDFEARFLRRNIQRQLILGLLRPKNWVRMARTVFDRNELAIELYDREIFEGATFADLAEAGGPFIQINAADLAVGNRFTFHQQQFDLICSDLSSLKVARAVTASSAVPVLFNPLTFRNYAGSCGFETPAWFSDALASRKTNPRRFRTAKVAESYLDAEARQYIHLLDGGIADNLGLRGPLDNAILSGGIWKRLEQVGAKRPKRIAVIAVNAAVTPTPRFSRVPGAPTLGSVVTAISGSQIYAYNFETLELLRESMARWARDQSDEGAASVETYLVEVAFDSLEEEQERAYFNALPTSFYIGDEGVDRLIEAGGRLLRGSTEFRALLTSLGSPDVAAPDADAPPEPHPDD